MSKISIVLVDDELTSRNTIKKMLEHDDTYEVVADFSGGKAALDWLRLNDTDILLCDMQMPEMNGVELMRSIHIINEYLPIIAVSGFDDFDFVKGSLVNGAANYLLKHELSRESLIHALEQVREKYRIIPDEGTACRKIGYCIDDEMEFTAERIGRLVNRGQIDFSLTNVVSVAVGPDYKIMADRNPYEYRQDICSAITDMLNQMLGGRYQYLIYRTKEWHLVLLLSFSGECSTLLMINTVNNLINRLQRQIIRMLDITTTIAGGNVQRDLAGAIGETKYLQQLLRDKLYLGGNRVLMASVTKPIDYSETRIADNWWRQLRFELELRMNGWLDILHDMYALMERERAEKAVVAAGCRRMVELLAELGYLTEQERGDSLNMIEECELFEQFRSGILALYGRIMEAGRAGRAAGGLARAESDGCSAEVAQTMEYIRANFAGDITLEFCAELTGCSYTQLSRAFKKETGLRFVEFLNRQRVNKAMSLLIRNEHSMKEIAELSGFRNYNYFFKVFKETEGITPSEFLVNNGSGKKLE